MQARVLVGLMELNGWCGIRRKCSAKLGAQHEAEGRNVARGVAPAEGGGFAHYRWAPRGGQAMDWLRGMDTAMRSSSCSWDGVFAQAQRILLLCNWPKLHLPLPNFLLLRPMLLLLQLPLLLLLLLVPPC